MGRTNASQRRPGSLDRIRVKGLLRDVQGAIPLMSRELTQRVDDRSRINLAGKGSDFDEFSVQLHS